MKSQSALRIWYWVMIQSSFSETPSSRASACPSSTWNPGGSPALLANGSELGWAHSPSAPSERIVSRDRACAGPIRPKLIRPKLIRPLTAPTKSGGMAFMSCSRFFVFQADRSDRAGLSLLRLQRPDVLDDRVDLRLAQGSLERRHRARLAVL